MTRAHSGRVHEKLAVRKFSCMGGHSQEHGVDGGVQRFPELNPAVHVLLESKEVSSSPEGHSPYLHRLRLRENKLEPLPF